MTTTFAAPASKTRSVTLDLAPKPTSGPAEPGAFASKLHDAQTISKDEAPSAAGSPETKKPIEKHRASEATDDHVDAAPTKPKAKVAKKPTDEPTTDQPDAGDAKPEATSQSDVKKKGDDALLAALAASAAPVAAKIETTPHDAPPSPDANAATVAATAVAANGVAQATAPVSHVDSPNTSTDAKAKAVQANDAKPASGDAKLDALAAKLKPVDDPNASLPPEAAEHHGGEAKQHSQQQPQQQSSGDANAAIAQAADPAAALATKSDDKEKSFDDVLAKLAVADAQPTRDATPAPAATPSPTLRPEQQFAKDNVDRVVSTVQSHVEAGGNGTMNVRLDPPELGALDVAAKMLDGKMSVAFTTSNEQATQLLSHSLNHLKASLESAGITVDRIEVRQGAATSTNASSDRDASGQQQPGGRGFESATQQQGEQQRKQMVEKLWRKYAYGSDEVDLVA